MFILLGIKFLAQEESVHCMRTVDNLPTEYPNFDSTTQHQQTKRNGK